MGDKQDALATVKEYYGKVPAGSKEQQATACCSLEVCPPAHQAILAEIDDELLDRFYGCGSPIPAAIDGCTVLDLGCGTGRDAYLASKLVGQDGFVIGVDMTVEQLAVARKHLDSQTKRFGFNKPNLEFRHGCIEDLADCGIADNSIDLVISNCVINLSPDKEQVFSEIFRVLKPGGELYFSAVFVDRRLPVHLKNDPVLYGECLGGALYSEDFRRLLRGLGCMDYRVLSRRPVMLDNPAVFARIGQARFCSCTIRAFKLACLEDACEDYGQVACYNGTLPGLAHYFDLDDHHRFYTGKPMPVCGNSAAMVQETRFGKHFAVTGDRSVHFGAFPCGPAPAQAADSCAANGCC